MKPTTPKTLTERLQTARQAAVATKIALRHAKNKAADFLTWFAAAEGYDGLGKNPKAREIAFGKLLADSERAHECETAVRKAEDANDLADCALACVLDEKHIASDQTWAVLADWVRDRTGRVMGSREQAGQEILKEQVETSLVNALAEYHERYGGEEFVDPPLESESGESQIPF